MRLTFFRVQKTRKGRNNSLVWGSGSLHTNCCSQFGLLPAPNSQKSIYAIRNPWFHFLGVQVKHWESNFTPTWIGGWLSKQGGFDLDMEKKNSLAFLSKIVYCPFQWSLAVLVFVYCHRYQCSPWSILLFMFIVGQPHFSLSHTHTLSSSSKSKKQKQRKILMKTLLEIRITKLIMDCVCITPLPLLVESQERETKKEAVSDHSICGLLFTLMYLILSC